MDEGNTPKEPLKEKNPFQNMPSYPHISQLNDAQVQFFGGYPNQQPQPLNYPTYNPPQMPIFKQQKQHYQMYPGPSQMMMQPLYPQQINQPHIIFHKRCQQKGCQFKCTGVLDGYCCYNCKNGKPHGPRCLQQKFQIVQQVCSTVGCNLICTGVIADYCCVNCSKGIRHGGYCKHLIANHQCHASECKYMCTGVIKDYCCGNCSQKKPHGYLCRRIYPMMKPNEQFGGQPRIILGQPQKMMFLPQKCQSQGCYFLQTGVVNGFCCQKCKNMGQSNHGGRCLKCSNVQQLFQIKQKMKQIKGYGKCQQKGCHFLNTGVVERFCCYACKNTGYNHGQRCQNLLVFNQKCQTKNCQFLQTGVVNGFCCRKCKNQGKGGHGGSCKNLTSQQKCSRDKCNLKCSGVIKNFCCVACSKNGSHGPQCISAKKSELSQQLQNGQKCQTKDCNFRCTGVKEGFCCVNCSNGKKHGGRCMKLSFYQQQY